MSRLSKVEWALGVAQLTARRSTCGRLQVGCVLTDPRMEEVTVGYNGSFRGGPNTCWNGRGAGAGAEQPGAGACGCVHAEANAVAKAGRGEKLAFVTVAPCVVCAQLLVNAGVVQVYYGAEYRSREGLEVLDAAGVPYTLA